MWGTRGSLATPGPETARYGGNTACVEVRGDDGTLLVLDAGTGIRRLSDTLPAGLRRVDVLLTHLHMDHLQGLGFFDPLYQPECAVHVWGPRAGRLDLGTRLSRYLSPPLFPVHLRSLTSPPIIHELPGEARIGGFRIRAEYVCHPGPTMGYRIEDDRGVLAYLPDHEPALGATDFPGDPEWTSGFALASGADLLIHDAQYSDAEYASQVGWGHSSIRQAVGFARHVGARHLVLFHHDPQHGDDQLDQLVGEAVAGADGAVRITTATEEATFTVGRDGT